MAALVATPLWITTIGGQAEVIYYNATHPLGLRTDSGNGEIGDIVTFEGSARVVTRIEVEYFVTPVGSPGFPRGGSVKAQLRIYRLDGPDNLPNSLIYSSPPFTLKPQTVAGFGTVDLQWLALRVPDSIAWTISFSGIDTAAGESAGLLFHDPPEIGSSPAYDGGEGPQDFHLSYNRITGRWERMDTAGVIDNFGVRFSAMTSEPKNYPKIVLTSIVIAGLIFTSIFVSGLLLVRRRIGRKESITSQS